MKPKHVVTVAKSGAIYIPKLTTKYLGIFDWAGVAIAVEEKYIYMRFCKHSITQKEGELVVIKLQKKSGGRQAMTGGCRKFTEAIKDDFGNANYLDLHIKTMFADEESVRISLYRPSRKDEESTPECAEEAKKIAGKAAQVEIARWIRANGCADVYCGGEKGKFEGIGCPFNGLIGCGRKMAGDWLVFNGYHLEPEISLGTVSKPAEKQLDIFDLPGSKVASTPRTRPLPDGLPEWLSGPLSKGGQVRIVAFKSAGKREGWVFGAFTDAVFGKDRPVAAVKFDNRTEPSFIFVNDMAPCLPCLKSAAECLVVAKELKIGLSPMQIDAISSGGVPPEGHGLPDEMFE